MIFEVSLKLYRAIACTTLYDTQRTKLVAISPSTHLLWSLVVAYEGTDHLR